MSIDWDKPIETTEGKPARVISRDYRGRTRKDTNIVVQIEYDRFNEIHFYTEDGSTVYSTSPRLRNKTKKVTKWSNLYRSTDGASVFIAGPWWDTEEAANEHGSQALRWIKSVKVTWDEPCD